MTVAALAVSALAALGALVAAIVGVISLVYGRRRDRVKVSVSVTRQGRPPHERWQVKATNEGCAVTLRAVGVTSENGQELEVPAQGNSRLHRTPFPALLPRRGLVDCYLELDSLRRYLEREGWGNAYPTALWVEDAGGNKHSCSAPPELH